MRTRCGIILAAYALATFAVGAESVEPWFGVPIPASGYNPAIPDCGMSAAAVFDAPIEGLKRIGTLAVPKSADVPESSNASIGFESLDRGLFDPDRCYDKLAAAGVKWARVQTMWSRCEKEKGVYDFSVLDSVVDNLTNRGIRPWFCVSFGNTLYMTNCYTGAAVGCVPTLYGEECRAAWCAYVRELAKRYKGKVSHWEIWNESNSPLFWQPSKPNAKEYLELVKLTGGVIRDEIPEVKIGAVTSSPALNGWERDFFELGGAAAIDFWCGHAYGCVPERFRQEQGVATESTDDYVAILNDMRAFIDAKGGKHVEIWQGESGFPSWFPANHWLYPNGVCKEGWQSQANQAKWLLRRFITDRRAGIARSSFYQMADISRHYSTSSETRRHPAEHGILNGWTYKPKMSYYAFGNYNALFAMASYDASAKVLLDVPSGAGAPTVATVLRTSDGAPLFAYYAAFDFSLSYTGVCYAARCDAKLTVPAELAPRHPVLVDMLRGGVYEVSSRSEVNGTVTFAGLPLVDYPLVLADRHCVKFVASVPVSEVSYESDPQQTGDLFLPAKMTPETPVVLNIHGGGWSAMSRNDAAGVSAFFVENDCAVYSIDYRLASKETPWPACGDDCLKAAEFILRGGLAAHGLKPSRIWIAGVSAGGHLALWTGLNLRSDQVAGIISVSGIADPIPDAKAHPQRYARLFGGREPNAADFDSMSIMKLVRRNCPRILLTHAMEDSVVPIESAANFCNACRDVGNDDMAFFRYSAKDEPNLGGHVIWRSNYPVKKRLLRCIETEIAHFMGISKAHDWEGHSGTGELQEKAQALADLAVKEGLQGALQFCAYKDGKCIVDVWAGTMTTNAGAAKIDGDTLFPIFSTEKPLLATAVHRSVERGKLEYDKPVCEYWPEFRGGGKETLTVRELMGYRSGLPDRKPGVEWHDVSTMSDWRGMLEWYASSEPQIEPGTKQRYMPKSYGWALGGLLEKAWGRSANDILRDQVLIPAGIEKDFYFVCGDKDIPRIATVYNGESFETMNNDIARRSLLPSAWAVSSARGIAKFYNRLCGFDGQPPLISKSTLDAALKPCRHESDPLPDAEGLKKWHMIFGMGYGLWGEADDISRVFGHGGIGGSEGLCDRSQRLVIGYTCNFDNAPPKLREAFYSLVGMRWRYWKDDVNIQDLQMSTVSK